MDIDNMDIRGTDSPTILRDGPTIWQLKIWLTQAEEQLGFYTSEAGKREMTNRGHRHLIEPYTEFWVNRVAYLQNRIAEHNN